MSLGFLAVPIVFSNYLEYGRRPPPHSGSECHARSSEPYRLSLKTVLHNYTEFRMMDKVPIPWDSECHTQSSEDFTLYLDLGLKASG